MARKGNPWSFAVDPKRGRFSYREKYDPLQEPVLPQEDGDFPYAKPDDRFAERVMQRYGIREPEVLAGAVHKDMGIGPYRILLNTEEDLSAKGHSGSFSDREARIGVGRDWIDERPAWAANTIFHEMAHGASSALTTGQPKHVPESMDHEYTPPDAPGHFVGYKNRYDLARALDEQTRIEHGEAPDANRLAQYPHLKSVAPLSSNRLATPWGTHENILAQAPEAWNAKVEERNPHLFPDVMEPDPAANPHPGMIGPSGRFEHAPIQPKYRRIRPGVFGQVQGAFDRLRVEDPQNPGREYPRFEKRK